VDPRKKKAAELLRSGHKSQYQVAKLIGVDRATIGRWLKSDEEFREEVSREPSEEELSTRARGGLADLVPQAIQLLERALSDGDIPANKATMALNVIKAAAQLSPSVSDADKTLAQRLAELEKQRLDGQVESD